VKITVIESKALVRRRPAEEASCMAQCILAFQYLLSSSIGFDRTQVPFELGMIKIDCAAYWMLRMEQKYNTVGQWENLWTKVSTREYILIHLICAFSKEKHLFFPRACLKKTRTLS